jgi:hypothetical protein
MAGGLLLVGLVALLVWLTVWHRPWLTRFGRTIFDGFATAGSFYWGVPSEPAKADPDAPADVELPGDGARRTESTLAACLLDRTLAKDDYQRAMARLAAEDEERHPMSVPRWL